MLMSAIPRLIHQIWIGPNPVPDRFLPYMESWSRHHPGWTWKLWGEGDIQEVIPALRVSGAFVPGQNPALLSDILRVELLRLYGGLYVDCDFECLCPFLDWALQPGCFHYGDQAHGCPGSAFLAAPAGHPFLEVMSWKLAREVRGLAAEGKDGVRDRIYNLTGPGFLAHALRYYVQHWHPGGAVVNPESGRAVANVYAPDVVAFYTGALHPYFWTDAEHWKPENYPEALAAHHWAGSWFHS